MRTVRKLHIDLETYSDVDIGKVGLYRYADSRAFEILLIAYAIDDGPVTVIDLTQEDMPKWLVMALTDISYLKVAHNAAFERVCLSKYLGVRLQPDQWECTMVHAMMLGLPASLKDVGKALGLPEDKQKMSEGRALITYFCKPCKPTKANGGRTRNMPSDAPEKWDTFIAYNKRDVETEQEIDRQLSRIPIPESEKALYCLDQNMNDHGLTIDKKMLNIIIEYSDKYTKALKKEAEELTGGININSIIQLIQWIRQVEGINLESLTKEDVTNLLKRDDLGPDTRRVLEIRQEVGKTSVKKYNKTLEALCSDGRLHGVLQFYGAGRTGRWAGRLLQVQNLPRNAFDDIGLARDLVLSQRWDELTMLYDSINDVFATLIRTMIIPPEHYAFAVADYSAIEARVIAWLAGEKWRQDTFKNGGDIYCASAEQMFHVPVEKHGRNAHLRKKGKVAELALGYQGGVNAMKRMGGEAMGMTEEEMLDIVQKWRKKSPHIVALWNRIQTAAIKTIESGKDSHLSIKEYDPIRARENEKRTGAERGAYSDYFGNGKEIRFHMNFIENMEFLQIYLPSGRYICYADPQLEETERGYQITYMGQNQTTHKWERLKTYGGKLTENIVQAIARDCLALTLMRISKTGYWTVMHVHDEVIVEVPKEKANECLEQIEDIMAEPIPWAPGLILTADGFTSNYYRKD